MTSKTTMRRRLNNDGAYYSKQHGQWVYAGAYLGIVRLGGLESAYREIDKVKAGDHLVRGRHGNMIYAYQGYGVR